MRLAIIPARGGSKRIPRKNIKNFCGKPMLAWSIEAARRSGCFDRVVISTDDDEIADIAIRYGAEVPFLRPTSLSDDYTGTVPVVAHAINWHQQQGVEPSLVCCIYATAPFVRPNDITEGLEKLVNSGCDYAFSVTSYPFPIQRAVRINNEGRVSMFQPKYLHTRSQDLEEAFHDAGQFYWGASHAWLEGRPIFGVNSVPVVLPRYRVQDIDTPEDWLRAEWMFNAQLNTSID
ncbi:pseudaminic acid cytidylyltransferase [Pusillimonas sp. SM2304]|uniref:pseudaminic acid cytidylyltransferase n=1 Tax=Pusillimonas sp. SM2304 TaxID=3073241 RepID=UPI0028754078|nr:pseudaminic acid cytidylyltransferase [Pusillimonas sp. SM2304]MDS1140033.1 pseudaminic acid cytidylyltransferase [Pusillimonas sp. SM2304]